MKSFGKVLIFIAIVCMGLAMAACSSEEKGENYGEAYDVDYMTTDYVDQLLRDGAQTLVGTIEISGADDNYTVAVAEKKVVPNENYDEGYYIADKNMTGTYPLGSDMGILVMEDGQLTACTADEFMEKHSGDTESLYTLYLIGEEVELIQPLDPKEAAEAAQ